MAWFSFLRKKKSQSVPVYDLRFEYLRSIAPERKGEEFLKAYEQISWVYACVRLIAQSIASANWRLYRVNKKGEWEEIDDHPALKLFNNPNQFMTRSELFYLLGQNLELVGESFWLLVRDERKKIVGIFPLNSTRMELELENGLPKRWIYKTRGEGIYLELDDVVHIKYPNPVNPYRGLSPLRAVALAADTDYYASKWNLNFFYNATAPVGVIKSEQKLSDEEYKRLKAQIEAMYSGVDNAHKAILLEEGLDFKPIQLSHKDMEFLELRRFTRTEIAAIFGVPLSKLGISEEVNRATAYVNDYTFAKNTITPKLVLIREALNKYYLSKFEDNLVFDFDSIIPQDEEFLVEKYINFVKNGILTINEVRDELGYEPVEWGDKPFNPNMAVFYMSGKPPQKKSFDRLKYWENLVQKRQGDENFFKGWVAARFAYQQRKVIEKLKQKSFKKKDLSEVEIERLVEELLAFLRSEEEQKAWKDFYVNKMPQIFVNASKEYARDFGLAVSFDLEDPLAKEIMRERAQRFAQRVNETTWRKLKESLVEGLKQGESELELSKRVEEVMTLSKRQRAGTIARTEIFSAVNESHFRTLEQNGVQWKEWLTAGDERVRDAHAQADGQVVRVNEPFIVGGEYLMYPGDPSGSAENVINCRCTILPVIS